MLDAMEEPSGLLKEMERAVLREKERAAQARRALREEERREVRGKGTGQAPWEGEERRVGEELYDHPFVYPVVGGVRRRLDAAMEGYRRELDGVAEGMKRKEEVREEVGMRGARERLERERMRRGVDEKRMELASIQRRVAQQLRPPPPRPLPNHTPVPAAPSPRLPSRPSSASHQMKDRRVGEVVGKASVESVEAVSEGTQTSDGMDGVAGDGMGEERRRLERSIDLDIAEMIDLLKRRIEHFTPTPTAPPPVMETVLVAPAVREVGVQVGDGTEGKGEMTGEQKWEVRAEEKEYRTEERKGSGDSLYEPPYEHQHEHHYLPLPAAEVPTTSLPIPDTSTLSSSDLLARQVAALQAIRSGRLGQSHERAKIGR